MGAKRRILLKISGEALKGSASFAFDKIACEKIARSIQSLSRADIQLGIVVGGGNLFRGADGASLGFRRAPADQVGMAATLVNGLFLQETLAAIGSPSVLLSSFACQPFAELYTVEKAKLALETKGIVLFVGGTGHPFFSTDTAAALRACEIDAEMFYKATKVDGVYDLDPLTNLTAKKFEKLSYTEVLFKQLHVMDATAVALCRENKMPIYVFNLEEKSLLKAVKEGLGGTLIQGD